MYCFVLCVGILSVRSLCCIALCVEDDLLWVCCFVVVRFVFSAFLVYDLRFDSWVWVVCFEACVVFVWCFVCVAYLYGCVFVFVFCCFRCVLWFCFQCICFLY